MSDIIELQEKLAERMLELSSFCRLFAQDNTANLGRCQQGRRRFKQAAIKELMERGFNEKNAANLVQDAQDYASLKFNQEAEPGLEDIDLPKP